MDGLLVKKGTRRVRMAKMINVWVAIDSMNQPARNSPGSAWKAPSMRAKVAKSKSELIGPTRVSPS